MFGGGYSRRSVFFPVVSILVGLYIINLSFEFISLPESFSVVNSYLVLIAGIILAFSGLKKLVTPGVY